MAIDAEGYVAIKGRAKRFVKIAGEMVSLGAIEDLLSGLWPEDMVAASQRPTRGGANASCWPRRTSARRKGEVEAWMKIKGAATPGLTNGTIREDEDIVFGVEIAGIKLLRVDDA